MARNNLGLPYKGSKNTIANQIVAQFPRAHSFLDACCGGGAVLEAAYLSGKFDMAEGIDIDEGIITLLNAVFHYFGKIDYEHKQLVTAERYKEAVQNRATLEDAVDRFIASFGFNGYDYQWGEKRRHLKYLAHQAMTLSTLDERRTAFHGFIRDLIKSGTVEGDRWSIGLSEIKNLAHTEQATNLCRLQKVERTMRDASKNSGTELVISNKSMFDIDYDPYDVIYFDPPYSNTKGYDKKKFDFGKFNAMLEDLSKRGKHVFLSEYKCEIPCFTEIFSVEKQMSQCDHLKKIVTERLFYGGSKEQYEDLMKHSQTQN